jgi:hypothetical protein
MFALAVAPASNAEERAPGEKWEFHLQGYGWIAAMDTTSADGDEISLSFEDIIENLDFVVMAGGGARKGLWSLNADLVYLNLGSSSDQSLNPLLVLDRVGLKSVIVTASGGYTVVDESEGHLDLLLGGRYLYIDVDLDIKTAAPLPPLGTELSADGSNIDGIIGVKGEYNFSEKVFLPFYADVGTGESDLTWQVFGGIGYRFETFEAVLGYRYLKWEFDNNAALEDLAVGGPILGARFRF